MEEINLDSIKKAINKNNNIENNRKDTLIKNYMSASNTNEKKILKNDLKDEEKLNMDNIKKEQVTKINSNDSSIVNKTEVLTYGCRLNTYESQIIKDNLKEANLDNVVVFNTCAVTQEAENQAIQEIKKYKKKHPDKKIIITGCAAQINAKKFYNMQEVDLVLGNQAKLDVKNYTLENIKEKKMITSNIFKETESKPQLVTNIEGRTRAFIEIQNGCDHYCTFCIIPRGRGKNRAVPVEQIINQMQILLNNGYKEIVFTGVDITDYGKNIDGNLTLAKLIKRVLLALPDFNRLRLSSIDVAEVDEELFEMCAFEKRILPHFHISIQSGDNYILSKMKRRHKREQVIAFCNKLRSLRPEVSFGADIIVGFPYETDEMFLNTCNIVHEAGLQFLHIFPYSIRENTPAAKMEQIDDSIKKERVKMLHNIKAKAIKSFYEKMSGTSQEVLIENGKKAKTNNFVNVDLRDSIYKNHKEGEIVKVDIIYKEDKLIAI